MKIRLLRLADTASHRPFGWYHQATPFGRHLPGWQLVQLAQWRLCNAYERTTDG